MPIASRLAYETQARTLCEQIDVLFEAGKAARATGDADIEADHDKDSNKLHDSDDEDDDDSLYRVNSSDGSQDTKYTPPSSEDDDADPPAPLIGCVRCAEVIQGQERVLAACGHSFCAPCIREYFSSAIRDGSTLPPTCCVKHPLEPKEAARFMGEGFTAEYERKRIELATKDRT